MRLFGLHKNIYKLAAYSLSQGKCEEYRKEIETPVRHWQLLKQKGFRDDECQEIVGISRSKYYRLKQRLDELSKGILPRTRRPKSFRKPTWGQTEIEAVLSVRRANPTYGKAKIAVILKRDHAFSLSESMVGRILKHLKEKGLITKSASAPHIKRKRRFKGHAKAWEYGMKATEVGQMIQIDHMSVYKNSCSFKHFQAWDPTSKYIHAEIFSQAKSSSAAKFLEHLIAKAPFKIQSIQVDGGSEFMKDFEKACERHKIHLYVLPPRRPQFNGGVERGNRIFREELYNRHNFLADSIGAARIELKNALLKYNTYRPHNRLNGLTPMQYIHNQQREAVA